MPGPHSVPATVRVGLLLGVLAFAGCAGTLTTTHAYKTDAYELNVPVKDEGCYDSAVLLGADAPRTQDIAGKVVAALDSTVTAATDGSIAAQRNRHVGVFVGSGGEELMVTWKAVDASQTFVTAATKTGFVGGAGQRGWSCEIVDKMVELATKK
ncbi:hypothetical protein [Anaeromyxobacter oryzisoli]|uniref:hypothetical protein n=1 Tax=Anaeromyxobacter oryzisoli TaxID=2925408 RepID=UPI001F5633B9|nr:hypothetical protein [Anaeromyxobacter sp. SG63]